MEDPLKSFGHYMDEVRRQVEEEARQGKLPHQVSELLARYAEIAREVSERLARQEKEELSARYAEEVSERLARQEPPSLFLFTPERLARLVSSMDPEEVSRRSRQFQEEEARRRHRQFPEQAAAARREGESLAGTVLSGIYFYAETGHTGDVNNHYLIFFRDDHVFKHLPSGGLDTSKPANEKSVGSDQSGKYTIVGDHVFFVWNDGTSEVLPFKHTGAVLSVGNHTYYETASFSSSPPFVLNGMYNASWVGSVGYSFNNSQSAYTSKSIRFFDDGRFEVKSASGWNVRYPDYNPNLPEAYRSVTGTKAGAPNLGKYTIYANTLHLRFDNGTESLSTFFTRAKPNGPPDTQSIYIDGEYFSKGY